MKVKACLFVYSLIIVCIPPPPNPYSLVINTIGTVVASCATLINLLYFKSLPSMQFTCAQPLIMAFMVTVSLLSIKMFVFFVIRNSFFTQAQELLQQNPLLLCGLGNNRPIGILALIFLNLYSISKLVLVVDPMRFHAFNHEQVSVRCFVGVAVYFVLDVVLYLVLGNVHFCHPDTLKLFSIQYKLDLKLDVEEYAHFSLYHRTVDIILVMGGLILEFTIQVCAWKNHRRIVALKPQELRVQNQMALQSQDLREDRSFVDESHLNIVDEELQNFRQSIGYSQETQGCQAGYQQIHQVNQLIQPPVNQQIQSPGNQLIQSPVNQQIQSPGNQQIKPPVNQLIQSPVNQQIQPPVNQQIQPPVNQQIQPPVNQ